MIYLTSTDTIVGFVSRDCRRLNEIKSRPIEQPCIMAIASLSALREHTRIPIAHRCRVRRSKRTTFVLPNGRSYRIIRDSSHSKLIRELQWAYTTSANPHTKPYDEQWAKTKADIVIYPLIQTHNKPSSIYRLGHHHLIRLR